MMDIPEASCLPAPIEPDELQVLPSELLLMHVLDERPALPHLLIGLDADGELLCSSYYLQDLPADADRSSWLTKVDRILDLVQWRSEYDIPIMVSILMILHFIGIPFSLVLVVAGLMMYRQKFVYSRRLRHEVRTLRLREAHTARNAIISGLESAEWLNTFLDLFWTHHQPLLTTSLHAYLSGRCDASRHVLDLSLLSLNLGSRFVRLSRLRVSPFRSDAPLIQLEANLDWDSDLEIALLASKSPLSVSLRIAEIKLAFRIQILIGLSSKIVDPCYISRIRIQIDDPDPEISFTIKPLNANVDIYENFGIVSLLRGLVFSAIQENLCPPNYVEIPIDPDSLSLAEMISDSSKVLSVIRVGRVPPPLDLAPSSEISIRHPTDPSALKAVALSPLAAIQGISETISHTLYSRWTKSERSARSARKVEKKISKKNKNK